MKPEILGPIRDVFTERARNMIANSGQPQDVTPETVYQLANARNRELVDEMLDRLALPGSELVGIENLIQLYERSRSGESCLILMEHYSNFDLPALIYLLAKQGQKEAAEAVIAIAGMKLNSDSPFVRSFTEAYTRIVIYPSRSVGNITDPAELEKERRISMDLNMAATRMMIRLKHQGHMVLVFPSGTRYRPGQPDTKRGVKEVDSYIRSFDTMVFVGIAGNVLQIHPTGDMSKDLTTRDVMILSASEPVDCGQFRTNARNTTPDGTDPKQYVADQVMARLETMHAEAETLRAKRLAAIPE